MEPEGRVALVTGAAAGTGRAIALRLAAEGAVVVVADVDPAGGAETVRAIEAQGGRASFVRADVTSADDVQAMIDAAEP
jgi:NAD(P)-dependent dehydrogenase (short-subunit alcohol dehydrogenase family)